MNSCFRFKMVRLLAVTGLILWCGTAEAASFSGDSGVEVADPSGGLSWVPANNAFTVSCWFKLSVPSSVSLSENMTLLVNRRTGNETDRHAFLVEFNASTGKVEFSTRGDTGAFTNALIDQPYLDRWYHVAIVRNGNNVTGYIDGFQVFSEAVSVGNSATNDGVSIGGWSGGKYLYGEVQEVAIYQSALSQEFIVGNMFSDQPVALSSLVGYYKLGATNSLANSAQNPPPDTNLATTQGAVTFEETNQLGEQSAFDSRRNEGRDAVTPLSGASSWEQTAIKRPTPGVPFEFRFGNASGNAFNSSTLGGFNPFSDSKLGSGWKHTFDARIVPSQYFSPVAGLDSIGLMLWDGSLEVWDYNFLTELYQPRHGEYRGEFRFISSSTCEWVTPDRLIYRFRHPFSGSTLMRGRLLEIRDFNGNVLTVNWDQTLGRVASVADTAGGVWTFTYNAQDRLASVSGPNNNPLQKWTITFTYDAQNRLATKAVTGPAAYTGNPAINTQWQFFYTDAADAPSPVGLLKRVVDPRGKNDTRITYDTYGRKTQERDAIDRVNETKYGVDENNNVAKRKITHLDPAGKKWVESYDRRGRVEEKKDPLGNRTTFEHDGAGNVSAVLEPEGNVTADPADWRTEFTYDARANILTKKDALGRVWTWEYNAALTGGTPLNKPTKETRPKAGTEAADWETRYTYDGAGNLRFQEDDIGTLAEHTYGNVPLAAAGFTAKGLALSSKDANQHQTTFGYDGNGFLASRTEAVGTPQAATWNFTRSELGWLLSESNPIPTETTTHQYDINGHVIASTDPLARTVRKGYDANGNLVSEKDAKHQETIHTFDDADQRTQTLGRAGKLWKQTFNSRGLLETTTDPDNKMWMRAYDDAGRLTSISDPPIDYGAGPVVASVGNEYDRNGNQTVVIDKLNQRWKKEFDQLNRVVAEEDPLRDRKTTDFDAAGRILAITNPRGFAQTHEYDGRSRLRKWTDAEGFAWIYTYDGVGNITDIEDALHGHYAMTYGPRNERLSEANQEQPPKVWNYTYDPLLRLATQTDPNGTVRTLTYDHGGRLTDVAFSGGVSAGRSDVLGYDLNNNPESITRTVGGVTTATGLGYDAMDRVTSVTDAFGTVVGYGYDDAGRIQTKTYPGGKVLTHGYDGLSRLTSLSFAFAAGQTFSTTFAYDKASRLTARTYPNAITQTVAYDTAGRLSSLGYGNTVSPTIALNYAYDRNGNKTSSTERGLLRPPRPSSIDETGAYTAAGRLQSRIDAADPTHTRDFAYTYDPSGNMTQAASAGQSYGFTYDEDNRVMGVTATGATAAAITNRYDALGRRIARTLNGTETRYVLDLTGGMERILADTDAAGAVTAYYIHGPDLCFRVDATTDALTCYHADAQGNIVRTTDAARAIRSEYAYTPYGRLLGQNGPAPDAYRFVGSQGVMEELPNLYFMRARYYSTEAGVFLSTDPVKNIGPGWKSEAYGYAAGNPGSLIDPSGKSSIPAFREYETWLIKPIADVLEVGQTETSYHLGLITDEEYELTMDSILSDYTQESFGRRVTTSLATANTGIIGMVAGELPDIVGSNPHKNRGQRIVEAIPGLYTAEAAFRAGRVSGNLFVAGSQAVFQSIGGSSPTRGPPGPNANSTPMWVGDVGKFSFPQGTGELGAWVAPIVNKTQAIKSAPPTTSNSINLSDPKVQKQLEQISKTLTQISKLVNQLQKETQAAQKKAKASKAKGKKK